MSFILVIDDTDQIAPAAEECVSSSGLDVVPFTDVAKAKRSLMDEIPKLILCKTAIGDDERAGLKLCSDLRDHDSFSGIPVLLFVENVKEDIVKGAQHFGARGIFSIPVVPTELNKVLMQLLPGVVVPIGSKPAAEEEAEEDEWDDEEGDGLELGDGEELSDNLTYAQNILSSVLHNLKTSDLIHIVEPEDVPRIVYEMCRTVCDIKEEPKGDALDEEDDTDLDLDAAFGFKKK